MGDLFGNEIPITWQQLIFASMKANPQHTYLLLTKQPQNLIRWSPYPDKCFVGVSADNKKSAINACFALSRIKASVKFLSLEPLLSWSPQYIFDTDLIRECGIGWIIIGAQTKPFVAPPIEWVKEIVQAADSLSIPVFLKNSLIPIETKQPWGFYDGKYRQEYPYETTITHAGQSHQVFITLQNPN
jgi:protein gp37